MGTASKGELISAGEGKTFPSGHSQIIVKVRGDDTGNKVRGDDTGNKYEILELTVAPGSKRRPTFISGRSRLTTSWKESSNSS